jgi:hypothetical protein
MERIATETEEDCQKLIKLLESFNIEIVRTEIGEDFNQYFIPSLGSYTPPPLTPRDHTAMIGDTFYMPLIGILKEYDTLKGCDWPTQAPTTQEEFDNLPEFVKQELKNFKKSSFSQSCDLGPLQKLVNNQGNKIIYDKDVNSAMTSRIGKDLYFGTETYDQDQNELRTRVEKLFPDYRCHIVNTGGHTDSTFCPVKPGLIISLYDIPSYSTTFPGWEVIYLPGQSWSAVKPFLDLKEKNRGKWWVPGEELNDDFTDFVETWLGHWVGYVEETVFDVNMLVIDEKNVICNNYNEQVFAAFDRYGITPHIVNFRHRYFWDGGLHCITSDLHREGVRKDYFPERGF